MTLSAKNVECCSQGASIGSIFPPSTSSIDRVMGIENIVTLFSGNDVDTEKRPSLLHALLQGRFQILPVLNCIIQFIMNSSSCTSPSALVFCILFLIIIQETRSRWSQIGSGILFLKCFWFCNWEHWVFTQLEILKFWAPLWSKVEEYLYWLFCIMNFKFRSKKNKVIKAKSLVFLFCSLLCRGYWFKPVYKQNLEQYLLCSLQVCKFPHRWVSFLLLMLL